VPKYVVQFGNVKVVDEIMVGDKKVPRDRFVGVGEEIEIDANDPLVTKKHQKVAYDKEGQPYFLGETVAQVVPKAAFVPPALPVVEQPLPVVQDDDGEELPDVPRHGKAPR
jgi:hypothetical protein